VGSDRRAAASSTDLVAQLIQAINGAQTTGGGRPNHPRIDTRHNGQTGIIIPLFINSVLIPEKEKISQGERVNDRIETACRHDMSQLLFNYYWRHSVRQSLSE
jgi:hypothetical protein